ncbi:MAG TPA: PLP-dependent aspartate aminotransferase family protein [Chitinophagaceae bacterium]|nr:PLP-dependent aspartate aminotransferase family protein [Chitinophagaceae bacterium]HNA19026.1 PLP-dependent aspartate aminotransferase family protein [Chitinophagaceae bacterium]HNA90727.1 PLP-dependent aspartate aminotransferase family protein [Chitinophagaceae bacterium]HNA95590.1 PLP-dependent aspartate aminotransferase family protein [Chitinophagaceae bacterium]HND95351.1 PLP-dependent aspartate aminotransferase family protein [Chitinophagaceae bacterium]
MELSKIINELGEDRELYFNAIAPPIMQTSNFAFRKVADLGKAFEDEMKGYLYSRGVNPTIDILRKKLAALDGAEDCLVFNNGAAAIFAGIFANIKSGDHIVSVRAPYTWVQRMFDVILPRFNVSTTYIDGKTIEEWQAATKLNTTFYYLESPNSWNYALQPIEEVAQFAKSKGITTLIDNSYCTPLYQKPIEMGIDITMQTATKYIGGHSDTLGGVLCGSHAMMKKIFDSEYLNIGSGMQPFNAWLMIRGLRTLPLRLERITKTTNEVVGFIKQHPKISSFLFPFDDTFPQYELARRQMKGACGLITFAIDVKLKDEIVKFCESLQHIMMAVSWGGHESLIIPKCAGISEKDFNPGNIEHRYVRLYCGLEDADYLIKDLEQALNGI